MSEPTRLCPLVISDTENPNRCWDRETWARKGNITSERRWYLRWNWKTRECKRRHLLNNHSIFYLLCFLTFSCKPNNNSIILGLVRLSNLLEITKHVRGRASIWTMTQPEMRLGLQFSNSPEVEPFRQDFFFFLAAVTRTSMRVGAFWASGPPQGLRPRLSESSQSPSSQLPDEQDQELEEILKHHWDGLHLQRLWQDMPSVLSQLPLTFAITSATNPFLGFWELSPAW